MTQEVVDRLLDRTQTGMFTPDPCISLFYDANRDPQDDLEKQSISKPVSKAEKIRKPAPRASKKHQKSTLESPKTHVCKNMVFAIPSLRKPCFKSSNCQSFHHKIDAKSDLETSSNKNKEFNLSELKKLSEWAPKISKNE